MPKNERRGSSDAAPAVAEALAAAGTSLMPAAGSSEDAALQQYAGTIPMLQEPVQGEAPVKAVGARVELQNLEGDESLNGSTGLCQEIDAATGRFVVKVPIIRDGKHVDDRTIRVCGRHLLVGEKKQPPNEPEGYDLAERRRTLPRLRRAADDRQALSQVHAVQGHAVHKASCAADGVLPSVAVLRDADEAKLANLLDEFGAADAELSSMMYGKLIFVAPDGSPKSLGAMHTFTKAGGVGALVRSMTAMLDSLEREKARPSAAGQPAGGGQLREFMALGEALPKGCRAIANVAACAVSGLTACFVALREADAMAVIERALAFPRHSKLADEALMALANMVCRDAARLEEAHRRGLPALVATSMLAAEPAEVGRLMAGTRVLTSMWLHTDRSDPPAYPLRAAVNTADGQAALKRALDAAPPAGNARLQSLADKMKAMIARLNPLSS